MIDPNRDDAAQVEIAFRSWRVAGRRQVHGMAALVARREFQLARTTVMT